jgi:tetratricopeptide (TPR) repeat protein
MKRTRRSGNRSPTSSPMAAHALRQGYTNASSNTQSHQSVLRRIKVLRIAQKRLQRDLQCDDRNAEAYATLGNVLIELGDWDEAVRTLQQASHLGVYDTSILSSLGQAMFESERYEPSVIINCLEAASQLLHINTTQDSTSSIQNSKTTNAKKCVSSSAPLALDHFAYLARAYAANGQTGKAIRTLETHILAHATPDDTTRGHRKDSTPGKAALNSRARARDRSKPRLNKPSRKRKGGASAKLPRSIRFGGLGAHFVLCASLVSSKQTNLPDHLPSPRFTTLSLPED